MMLTILKCTFYVALYNIQIFQVAAAVLHLGNIAFEEPSSGGEGAKEAAVLNSSAECMHSFKAAIDLLDLGLIILQNLPPKFLFH